MEFDWRGWATLYLSACIAKLHRPCRMVYDKRTLPESILAGLRKQARTGTVVDMRGLGLCEVRVYAVLETRRRLRVWTYEVRPSFAPGMLFRRRRR